MGQVDYTGGDRLTIENVSFSYGDNRVFEGFNLDVAPGEFVSVIGPSGCGKTTLLNLLSGFSIAAKGRVSLGGDAVRPEHPNLGYMFQSANLFPWLTVAENVAFGLEVNGLAAAPRKEKTRAFLELVGLSGQEGLLPSQLSGGMAQRVSLARILVMEPRLLLMDEPFGALDAITRETMNDELLKIWNNLGPTVVFITHDIDEALYLSDRIIILGNPPTGIHRVFDNQLARPRSGSDTRMSDLFWQCKKELISEIAAVTRQ